MSQLRLPSRTVPIGDLPGALPAGAAACVAVFDLDGTLVDTAPDLAASLNHCLAARGLPPVTLEEVRPHAGHGARAMLEAAFGWVGHLLEEKELQREVLRFLDYYAGHIADLSRMYPGVPELLDRLRIAGFVLAVCTNKTEALADRLLVALGLDGCFAAVCGADTFHRRKPDPVHLLGTITRAGGRVDRAVMIGDTPTDVDAAWAAGIPSVLVRFGYGANAAALARADLVVSGFESLDAPTLLELLRREPGTPG